MFKGRKLLELCLGKNNNVHGDALAPVSYKCRDEMVQVLNEINTGKGPGPSEVSLELIAASKEAEIYVMDELLYVDDLVLMSETIKAFGIGS